VPTIHFKGKTAVEKHETQVYRHKVRLITDSMITRAFELGIEIDELGWLRELFVYDGTEKFIANYLRWDDARVTTALLHPLGKAGLATELFWKLKNRQLFKRVYSKQIAYFEGAVSKLVLVKELRNAAFVQSLEEKIADFLSSEFGVVVPKHHVVVGSFAFRSVKEQSRDSEGSIMILAGEKNPRKFEDVSTLFRSINEKENDQFIEVYAPLMYDGEVERRKKRDKCDSDITNIITNAVDTQREFEYGSPQHVRT
jgi:HD superfamily phosphohydrolase